MRIRHRLILMVMRKQHKFLLQDTVTDGTNRTEVHQTCLSKYRIFFCLKERLLSGGHEGEARTGPICWLSLQPGDLITSSPDARRKKQSGRLMVQIYSDVAGGGRTADPTVIIPVWCHLISTRTRSSHREM